MLLLFSACATMGMKLPPSLSSVTPAPVGHRGGVQLGAWTATLTDGGLGLPDLDSTPDAGPPVRTTTFRWRLAGPDAPGDVVVCESRVRGAGDPDHVSHEVLSAERALDCTTPGWSLRVSLGRGDPAGTLAVGGRDLPVRVVTTLASGAAPGDIVGWTFGAEGDAAAALELLNAGRTWTRGGPDDPPAWAVAAAFSALVLWRDELARSAATAE